MGLSAAALNQVDPWQPENISNGFFVALKDREECLPGHTINVFDPIGTRYLYIKDLGAAEDSWVGFRLKNNLFT